MDVTSIEQLKVLTNPLRMDLIYELSFRGRQARVSDLAQAIGKAPNSVSYHLALLEEHGFVIKVPTPEGRDSRETWYGLPEGGISINLDRENVDITPIASLIEKMQSVESSVLDRYRKTAREADVEDRRRMQTNSTSFYLTREQEEELSREVHALLEKFYEASQVNEQDLDSRSDLSQTYVRVEVFPILHPPSQTGEGG